jgi:riboflavin kinase/FMN adenylyltransferase
MKILALNEIPKGKKSVICIGVFDGVHAGHRKIILYATEKAGDAGAQSIAVTFEPHPEEVFSKSTILRLTSASEKAELINEINPDFLIRLPFDLEMASLEPEEFIGALLENIDVQTIVVGANFHFGKKASGDTETLKALGEKYGFGVSVVPLFEIDGLPVSSTRIKEALAKGQIDLAAKLLERNPDVTGKVVKGSGRGKEMGFPTVNIELENVVLLPMDGVYGGFISFKSSVIASDQRECGNLKFFCAISIGNQPTFDGKKRSLEAFILDFHGQVYGEEATVEFAFFVRPQKRFESKEALVSQIQKDVELINQKLIIQDP